MKQLKLYALSLRHHPGWWITVIYMGLPAIYEGLHAKDGYNWDRVWLGTAAIALFTLIPVLWTAWIYRGSHDDAK